MSAFSKLLVLCNALLLALPTGWCCAMPSRKTAEVPVAVTHSCCQHQQRQPTPSHEPAPVEKCCCEQDLVNPPHPESSTPDLTFSNPVAIPDASAVHLAGVGDLNFTCPFPSPPLNVLQCCWRC